MAHATIIGTLGKDPELKQSRDGQTQWAQMSLAWSESTKDKTGQWVDGPTVWIQVKAFRRQAHNIFQSLHKGDRVIVTGDLKPETWSSNQGPETVMSMVASTVAPELTFASTQVSKNPKGGRQGNQGDYQGDYQGGYGQQAPQSNDPWNSAPQGGGFGGGVVDDTPAPF